MSTETLDKKRRFKFVEIIEEECDTEGLLEILKWRDIEVDNTNQIYRQGYYDEWGIWWDMDKITTNKSLNHLINSINKDKDAGVTIIEIKGIEGIDFD